MTVKRTKRMMSHYPRVIIFAIGVVVLLGMSLLTGLYSNRFLNLTVDSATDQINQEKHPVAFCVLAKDEKDLFEWIDYHRQLGVSKFYVMDEYSDPPLSLLIPGFIESGLVEYRQYSFFWNNLWHYSGFHTKNHLRTAFDECLKVHGHKHKWLGFLDADEFIVLKVFHSDSLVYCYCLSVCKSISLFTLKFILNDVTG